MPSPKTELKHLIYRSGLKRQEVADMLNMSYHILNQQLGGFNRMPFEIEEQIRKICKDALIKETL